MLNVKYFRHADAVIHRSLSLCRTQKSMSTILLINEHDGDSGLSCVPFYSVAVKVNQTRWQSRQSHTLSHRACQSLIRITSSLINYAHPANWKSPLTLCSRLMANWKDCSHLTPRRRAGELQHFIKSTSDLYFSLHGASSCSFPSSLRQILFFLLFFQWMTANPQRSTGSIWCNKPIN